MQHRALTQLLTRAESSCHEWSRQHSKSISLLLSLSNIVTQQTAALKHSFEYINASRLVYKQSLAIEDVLDALNKVVDSLEDILYDLQRLENDAAKYVTKETTMSRALEPAPLSTETLIQTAAIQPHDVHGYIADVHFMLRKDFGYKQTLLDTLPRHMAHLEQLDDLQQKWSQQPHVRYAVMDQMTERIKLYKQVYKVVTSTD
ncbi:hypothetical protein BJV82DRAFT_672123 [Fennellomyces sp. T-0311]|nr:hypothetical protein BJV82DRAFT_672123 [Fennellomyces sp. T-0311]